MPNQTDIDARHSQSEASSAATWFALWTRSNAEKLVHDQLVAKGLTAFLPNVTVFHGGAKKAAKRKAPMFPGYLFLHATMCKETYIEICKARGLVAILGERWDKLAAIPHAEVDAIARIVANDLRVLPHPYLRQGNRVEVIDGALAGVEGILVQLKPASGLLVVSVGLFQRSVAVEVAYDQVRPINT